MLNSRYWRWLHPRVILRDLLALEDSSHAIALGAAFGMWVGMTPTVGIQMPILVCLWFAIRRWVYFNVTASLLMVLISNPLTTPPIYWFNYQLGIAFLGGGSELNFSDILSFETFAGWWSAVCALVVDAGWPLLVGSLVVATVLAIPTYFVMSLILRRFRNTTTAPGHAVLVHRPESSLIRPASESADSSKKDSASTFSKAV